ncbi:unnamed protein product [Anisakis simplex]|uniref:Sister chromatid cohesion protein DCC1 n=1 Tax=Anisakis simplex TaxID=6269 RepID=A0A0M3J4W4_ANISI|nr:unnamed protein product [Anisakis simplex]
MEKFLKRKPLTPTSGKTTEKPTSNHSNEREESNVKNRRSESNLLWTNVRGNINAVNALFDVAKLSHLKGEVQQIEFSEPLLSGDYRLLQVDPELADQIEKGSSLTFRGELDDYPVLCTKDATYCVKEAETSNTLLVLPQLDFTNDKGDESERVLATRKVIAMQSRYLELKKVNVVSSSRLRELLRENELQWDADEQADENMEQNAKLYTFDDLLDVVQMSEVQLRQALQHLPVIQQNGMILWN